jgi:parvulin-like peptidyl-prolyl isomerase
MTDYAWLLIAAGSALAQQGAPEASPPAVQEVNVATVVARVDDRAILLQEVVGPIKERLEAMRQQLPRDTYVSQERIILKQRTESLIERTILLKEVEAKIKDPKRLEEIRKKIGQEFERNLAKFAREKGIKGKEAILKQLEEEGSSLEAQRKEFVDTILAQEYVRQQLMPMVADPTREEMIAWHRDHAQQFQQNAGVVWRHIEVRIGSDPKAAAEKVHQAQQRLTAGEDFAKVAKELSDDASAINGGLCPKTSKGSYYEAEVDKALFTLPVGRFSTPIRGKDAFHIVKVEERTADGVKPFSEVQREIAKAIKDERLKEVSKAKMAEIRGRHFVESIYDKPELATQPAASAIR